jgi:hypothetical protein
VGISRAKIGAAILMEYFLPVDTKAKWPITSSSLDGIIVAFWETIRQNGVSGYPVARGILRLSKHL